MKYETPQMGIILLSDENVITASILNNGGTGLDGNLGIGDFKPQDAEVTE